jgi:hypothetical protein
MYCLASSHLLSLSWSAQSAWCVLSACCCEANQLNSGTDACGMRLDYNYTTVVCMPLVCCTAVYRGWPWLCGHAYYCWSECLCLPAFVPCFILELCHSHNNSDMHAIGSHCIIGSFGRCFGASGVMQHRGESIAVKLLQAHKYACWMENFQGFRSAVASKIGTDSTGLRTVEESRLD